jgi:hypothetical protein
MPAGLESRNNVRTSTAGFWKVVSRSIVCLVIAGSATGCGLWADELATGSTPPPMTPSTATATATPRAMATSTTVPATVIPTATPQPTIAIENLTPSTQLAYFHTISSDGDTPELLAEKADLVILTYGDEHHRDALRQAGYTGTVLQYLNASQVNGPGPYLDGSAECDAEYAPHRNGIARGVGDFCRDLHPNEDWFLHNGAGERLYSMTSDIGVWYHMNPGNSEWRAYASQAIAGEIVGPQAAGYDGAFLDNVELSLTRLTEQVVNAGGSVSEFPSDDEYRAAWSGYLEQIRAGAGAGSQIWASLVSDPNQGAYWSGYLAYLDGVMSPAFATGYDPLSVADWENNIEQAEAAIRDGKYVVAVGQGAQDDEDWQQFALASFLLISDGENGYFRYMSGDSRQALLTLWTYPNYEIALGAALGSREQVGATWRRDFQCGYVEVDPAARRGAIVQTACTSETEP